MRWDERQKLKAAQEESARRDVQEVDGEVDQNWAAACEWIATNMLKYLEDSEVLKVSTREFSGTRPVSRRVEREKSPHREAGEK